MIRDSGELVQEETAAGRERRLFVWGLSTERRGEDGIKWDLLMDVLI